MNAPVTDCRPDRNFSYQPAAGMTFAGFDVSYGRDTELRVTERPGLFIGLMLSGRSTSVHIGGAGTVDVPVARPIFINFLEETQCTNSYRRGDFCAGIGIHLDYANFRPTPHSGQAAALEFLKTRFKGHCDVEILPETQAMNELAQAALVLPADMRFRDLRLDAIAMGVIATACHGLEQRDRTAGTLSETERARAQLVAQHLQRDLARTPSLTELSQLAAVNPGTLADNFRAAFGQTIFAYFRELRLTAARRILRCESASITETSLRVGFNSPTAFATAYRRHFGYPPSHEQRNKPDFAK